MMLARSVFSVLASLLLLTASPGAEEPKTPPRPPEEVIEAWKKAGFKFGWYGWEPWFGYARMCADPSSRLSKLLGERPELPAFYPGHQLPEKLGGLPAPGTLFALDLSGRSDRIARAIVATIVTERTSGGPGDLPLPRRMTDARLKELRGMKDLAALDLAETEVTDQGLKELAGLGLTWLNLASTGVTDAGLKELKGLKTLTQLGLAHTRVTDAGLKELNGFQNLTGLDLSGTRVTDEGLRELAVHK
jgi:hypothetical protein